MNSNDPDPVAVAPLERPGAPSPRDRWLATHVWDCACGDCLDAADLAGYFDNLPAVA